MLSIWQLAKIQLGPNVPVPLIHPFSAFIFKNHIFRKRNGQTIVKINLYLLKKLTCCKKLYICQFSNKILLLLSFQKKSRYTLLVIYLKTSELYFLRSNIDKGTWGAALIVFFMSPPVCILGKTLRACV